MYLKLLGVFFKQQFSPQRLFGNSVAQSPWKKWFFIGLLVYAVIASIGSNLFLYFEIGQSLASIQQLDLLLLILFSNVSSVAVFLTLFQANGFLFAYKDFELLAPLPIPHWIVISAKSTMMLFFVVFFSVLLNGPILGVYFYLSTFSWISLLLSVVFYVLIPIPVMTLVSLFSWFIHRVATRFVNKNVMQIVLMLLFLGGYLTMSLGSLSEDLVSFFTPLTNFIETYYQPSVWFQDAIHRLDIVSILWFTFFHLTWIVFFIFVMTPLSKITNLEQSVSLTSNRLNKKVQFRPQSFFMRMWIKEWRYYFSVPIYFINTAFGLFIMIGVSIALLFFKDTLILSLGIPDLPLEGFILIFLGFSISTVYTPAVSLSLEGNNFYVLKSLPIQGKTIMLSKVLFNITLVGIPLIIAMVILGFSSWFDGPVWLLMLLNALLFTVLSSLLNGLLNLAFPKFDFQNEVEVVKQSLGAFFGVFSGFGILLILGLVYVGLNQVFDITLTLLSVLLLQILSSIGFFLIYNFKVNRWFAKLEG